MDGVVLSTASAQRTKRAVLAFERAGLDTAGPYNGKSPFGFTGIVYLSGKKFDLRADARKKWIKVDYLNGTVAYEDTDPADPFPVGCEYFETNFVHGDIHVTRFG